MMERHAGLQANKHMSEPTRSSSALPLLPPSSLPRPTSLAWKQTVYPGYARSAPWGPSLRSCEPQEATMSGSCLRLGCGNPDFQPFLENSIFYYMNGPHNQYILIDMSPTFVFRQGRPGKRLFNRPVINPPTPRAWVRGLV